MIRSTALYRKRNDVAGALIGFFLGFCLDIAQHYRRIVAGIAFNAAEQYFPCLVHRQSGNSLQLLELLIVKFLDGSLGVLSFFYLLVELLLALLVSLGLAVGHFTVLPLDLTDVMQGLVLVMLVGSFAIELKFHDSMKVSQVAWGFFGALLVPYLLLSLLRIFQMNYHHGPFIVLLPLLAAWGADTCALFAGMFFGRHKLAPVVSPKKTVEGAVGGVIGGAVLVLIAALIMNSTLKLGLPLWAAVVLGAVGAVLGEIGDLSFSIIKRQTGIKDYGHIFPGHGGVLDRFDSVIFVAPFAEFLFRIVF